MTVGAAVAAGAAAAAATGADSEEAGVAVTGEAAASAAEVAAADLCEVEWEVIGDEIAAAGRTRGRRFAIPSQILPERVIRMKSVS